MRIIDLTAGLDFKQIDELLFSATDEDTHVERIASDIVADVRRRGDAAVCDYTRKFDEQDLTPATIRVSEAEIHELASGADDELVSILRKAANNVREFHDHEKVES